MEGGIVAASLSKSYGQILAVDDVDLMIAPGETVALLGPNGAGKSTTLDMILGLQRPGSGRVSVFGMAPAEAVAVGAIGGMLQVGSPVEHMRVRELVELLASYYPRSLPVDAVLEMTGLEELAGRWASKLSEGQMQRVRFAGALVGDPDLIILDEPTAGVDVKGRLEFWRSMRSVSMRGKTTIFATHYLEESDAYADRIVLMSRGRIVADGPATEIKARATSRTIRATLPGVDVAELEVLPGVISAERHGEAVTLSCSDADAAASALFEHFRGVRDIEVRAESLEQAFLELTADTAGDQANTKEER